MNAPERASLRLTEFSHGGGCGCKIAPALLREIIGKAGQAAIPAQLLVGIETSDDAAVWQINDRQAIVATIRFALIPCPGCGGYTASDIQESPFTRADDPNPDHPGNYRPVTGLNFWGRLSTYFDLSPDWQAEAGVCERRHDLHDHRRRIRNVGAGYEQRLR